MTMKWKTPETVQRGFSGVYDAAGHRADVIALLQQGMTGDELLHESAIRIGRSCGAMSGGTTGIPSRQRKLKAEDIQAIRDEYRYYDAAFGTRALARRYGVSHVSIWKIVHGHTYREVA